MRKKTLTFILALVCLLCCSLALAACGEGDGHTHNYVRKYDETYHWQECTVSGCDAKTIDLTIHAYENNVCKDCGYVKGTDITITDNSSVKGYSYVFNDVQVESDGYDEMLKEYLNEMRKGFEGATMSFYTDGTFSSTTVGYTATGTYSQTGSKLTLTVSGQSSELTVTANSIIQYVYLPSTILPPAEETPDNPSEKPSETEPDYPEPTPETPALPEQSEGGEDYGESSDKARQAASSDNEIIIKIVYVKSSAVVTPPQGEHTHTYNSGRYGYTETEHWRVCDTCGNKGTTEPHSYYNEDLGGEGAYCKCGYYGHKHSFTQEVATSEYLAEQATDCEHTSKYYYSCLCGEHRSATFEYGAGAHKLDHCFAQTADCMRSGNIEYWSCRACEKYFSDQNGVNEITDKSSVTIPSIEHTYTDTVTMQQPIMQTYEICSACGKMKGATIFYRFNIEDNRDTCILTAMDGVLAETVYLPFKYNDKLVSGVVGSYVVLLGGARNVFFNTYYYTGYNYYNGTGVKEIYIPTTYTTIGDYAFYGCTGLTRIEISNSVSSVGRQAYAFCTGLKNVTIPESVVSVGGYAFEGCSITSVTLKGCFDHDGLLFAGCPVECIELPCFTMSDGKKLNLRSLIGVKSSTSMSTGIPDSLRR